MATKFSLSSRGADLNSSGNGRKSMMAAVENSLRRLKTNYIDLYRMHAWDSITPEEEVLSGLDDLVRAGKILHIGFSDTPAWVVSRAQAIAELRGWTSLAATQIPDSLADRTPDRELLPMARALGISVVTWGSLGSGLLSGKYQVKDGEVTGSGRLTKPDYPSQNRQANTFEIVEVLLASAPELNVTPSQLALTWLRHRSPNIIPIIGARTIEHFDEDLAAEAIGSEANTVFATLDAVSAVSRGFPAEFLQREPILQLLFGTMHEELDARSKLTV
ncbi:putative Aryl-alcohol dehydrogenase (NADP(+)) [Novosphingobium sp. 9U]|nr:putative Aryl-alcohol dehydrogenase (NADP(+)) [Novosphingobium sp. 9U]